MDRADPDLDEARLLAQRRLLKEVRGRLKRGERTQAGALLRGGAAALDAEGLEAAAEFAVKCGDPGLATECLTRLTVLEPDEVEWPCQLGHVARRMEDFDTANAWLAHASRIDTGHPLVQHLRLRLARFHPEISGPEYLLENLAKPDVPIGVGVQIARRLTARGLSGAAVEGLRRLKARSTDPKEQRGIETHLKVAEAVEACRAAGGEPLSRSDRRAAIVEPREGAETAVLVFSGIDGAFGSVLLDLTHALLFPLGVSTIHLIDVNRLVHLAGNPDLGRDYPETIRAIRRQLDAWAVRRVVTLGASAGGYAAVRYGLDLGADRILAFAPPTTLQRDVLWEDGRGFTVISRLEQYAPTMMGPLRPHVAVAGSASRIDLYFGSDMALDRTHAEALAGLEGVRLCEIPGLDHHGAAGELLVRGELPAILAEAVKGEATA